VVANVRLRLSEIDLTAIVLPEVGVVLQQQVAGSF
jgi:hypothetical protein